jgi:predicted transcriptional regulator
MIDMAMTLRLTDEEADALRRRAQFESRSMHEVVRTAVCEYIENHSRQDLLEKVLEDELPRYAEALDRLGQ